MSLRANVAYSYMLCKGLAQVSVAQGSSSAALWASTCLTQAARTLWAWGTQRPVPLPCVGVHLRATPLCGATGSRVSHVTRGKLFVLLCK